MRFGLCVAIALALVLVWTMPGIGHAMEPAEEPSATIDTYRATVLEAEEVDPDPGAHFGGMGAQQRVVVEVHSGPWEGEHTLANYLTGNPAYDIIVAPGDRVLVGASDHAGETELFITDFVRDVPILFLLGAFAAALVLVGGLQGLKTLLVLGLTALAVFYGLIPAILAGWPPVVMTVVVSAIVVSVSLLIIVGRGTKTVAAVIGTVAGVLFAGVLAALFGRWAHLMGLHTQESQMLLFTVEGSLDFRGLLFSGMILGALGAVMDVSVSIASAVEEVHRVRDDTKFGALVRSGMNVGRDVLGTMSNTLILAYAGSALPLILLLVAHRADFVGTVNMDVIATEIIRALTGSIGLILCVPVTALTAGWLKVRTASLPRRRAPRAKR